MKHARADYNRIQDPAGKIPADEPVFLIRGQDKAAPGAVRAYAEILESMGGDPELVRQSREQSARMEDWQDKVRSKVADAAPAPDKFDSADDRRAGQTGDVLRREYRTLTPEEQAKLRAIKDAGEALLALIGQIPQGREAAIARTKTEEAVMWAVKGLTA